MNKDNIIHRILSLKPWHLIILSCLTSEIFTTIFSTISYRLFFPDASREALIVLYSVGVIDAFAVAFIVSALLVFIKQLYEYQLEKSHKKTLDINTQLEMANQNLENVVHDLARSRDEAIKSEHNALQATKSKSDFLANMSHELRTPLNAIIGYSEMLQEIAEEEQHSQYKSDLDRINQAAHHLSELINTLLDLSKIEAGKMELNIKMVDIQQLVTDVYSIVSPLAKQNNNQFTYHVDNNINMARTDEIKLRQSLLNLLGNALKFTHDGSVSLTVSLSKSEENTHLNFSVADTGIGLTKEQAKTIFQEFNQAETDTCKNYGGTGLGLSITQRFAQMMGGDIHVNSEVSKGSTFRLSIPYTTG